MFLILLTLAAAAVVTTQSGKSGIPGQCQPPAGIVPSYPPHPDGDRFCGIRECFLPDATVYHCPNGYANDMDGCQSTRCLCEGCPYFCPSKYCKFGFKVGGRGCPTTQCKEDPNATLACPRMSLNPPAGAPCSAPATCRQGELCCNKRPWFPFKHCVKGVRSVDPEPPRWYSR